MSSSTTHATGPSCFQTVDGMIDPMCCTLGLREEISLQKIGHRLAGFCGNLQESCHLLPGDVESCEALSLPPQMATSTDGPSGRDIYWKLHSIAQQFAYVWLRAERCVD